MKIKFIGVLLFFSNQCMALDSDRDAKIVIEGPAGSCKLQLKQNTTECTNGLTIKQGTLFIKSAYALINHQDKGIDNVLMKGQPVYMEQMGEDGDKMTVEAKQMDYKKKSEKVFLSGNVNIKSSLGVTTGENIEFDLITQEIISSGDGEQQFRMEIDQKND